MSSNGISRYIYAECDVTIESCGVVDGTNPPCAKYSKLVQLAFCNMEVDEINASPKNSWIDFLDCGGVILLWTYFEILALCATPSSHQYNKGIQKRVTFLASSFDIRRYMYIFHIHSFLKKACVTTQKIGNYLARTYLRWINQLYVNSNWNSNSKWSFYLQKPRCWTLS